MTEASAPLMSGPRHRRGPDVRVFAWTFLGIVPFLAFAALFLVVPTIYLVVGSFQDQAGHLTLENYANLTKPITANAYAASLEISLVTAIPAGSSASSSPTP